VKKFKIKSFCKINLSLRVLKKLNSGYHIISSIITFCHLYDIISVKKIEGRKDLISFSGKFKNKINKKNNTLKKVLHLLRKKKILKKQAFEINVKKNIPHGSGLGGGSSNAANLLNFLNSMMQLKLNKKRLTKISNQIGFDVPILLEKRNTLLTGKKHQILRLNQKFRLTILIVFPNVICSTKKIYARNKTYSKPKPLLISDIKSKNQLILFLKKEINDLEEIVVKLHPQIGRLINIIKIQNGCYFSRISGSGSACIGIFSNMKSAIYTQKLIKRKFPKYWCVVSKTI
tara:strand:+ start:670 stop:1533 length:864 start_codon:yes stop_codon:yes gene_type:complete